MNGSEADEEWSEDAKMKDHSCSDDDVCSLDSEGKCFPIHPTNSAKNSTYSNLPDQKCRSPKSLNKTGCQDKIIVARSKTRQCDPHFNKLHKDSETIHSSSSHDGARCYNHSHNTQYSDTDRDKNEYSDIDSIIAEQVEAKFKEIMNNKKGGYLDVLQSRIYSDQEVDLTGDRRRKQPAPASEEFPESNNYSKTRKGRSHIVQKTEPSKKLHITGYTSDLESIMTEDFESKFNDLIERTTCDREKNNSEVKQVKEVTKPIKSTQRYRSARVAVKSPAHPPPSYAIDDGSCERTNDSYEPTDDEVARNAQKIEIESGRIQREISQERRSKSSPAHRSTVHVAESHPHVSQHRPRKHVSLRGAQSTESLLSPSRKPTHLRNKNQSYDDNVVQLPCPALNDSEMWDKEEPYDLQQIDEMIQWTRENYEDSRNQLLLSEKKRDQVMKELENLTHELNSKRKKVKAFESEARTKLKEIQQYDSKYYDLNQIKGIVESQESLLRDFHTVTMERDELVTQLETCRANMFRDQKLAHSKQEESLEEIQTVRQKIDEVTVEKQELSKKLSDMNEKLRDMELKENNLLTTHEKEMAAYREQTLKDNFELMRQSTHEIDRREAQLNSTHSQIAHLQTTIREKDQHIYDLKNQNKEITEILSKEREGRKSDEANHIKALQSFRLDADTSMVQLKEQCFMEKQKSLESLRDQLEIEKQECLAKCEEKFSAKLTEMETAISDKESHTKKLECEILSLHDEKTKIAEKVREENKDMVREAVLNEQKRMKEDLERFRKHERDIIVREMDLKYAGMREEVERKENDISLFKDNLLTLKQELDEQKHINSQNMQENLLAVARAKDMVRSEKQKEFENDRENINQKYQNIQKQMSEKIKKLENEVKKLRQEKLLSSQKEKQQSTALDRTERTLLHEINEECRRTACILGLSPRKVCLSSRESKSPDNIRISSLQSATRSHTMQALANLRACTEELRHHTMELKQEIQLQKLSLNRSQKDKEECLESLRWQTEREKTQELEMLKERLLKEHTDEMKKMRQSDDRKAEKELQVLLKEKQSDINEMQKGMRAWKEEMAQKFAEKFQEELKFELEKSQYNRHEKAMNSELIVSSQKREIDRLKEEIKRLNNLTSISDNTKQLEVCQNMANISPSPSLARKLAEMDKLQSSVNQQHLDLKQLQSSYKDIQNYYQCLTRTAQIPASSLRPTGSFRHGHRTNTVTDCDKIVGF